MHQKGEGGAELWHCNAAPRAPVPCTFSTFPHSFSRLLCRAADRKVVGLMGKVAWLHAQSPRSNLFLSVTPQDPESDNSSAYCLDFSQQTAVAPRGRRKALVD